MTNVLGIDTERAGLQWIGAVLGQQGRAKRLSSSGRALEPALDALARAVDAVSDHVGRAPEEGGVSDSISRIFGATFDSDLLSRPKILGSGREPRRNQPIPVLTRDKDHATLESVNNFAIQLPLELSPPRRWGGRRARAGRKPGPRPCTPRAPRRGISRHAPCHVTLRLRGDVPSLRRRSVVREIERSLRASCERGSFRVVHYSLQRDHVHLLVEADGTQALARGMMSIGARIARAVNRLFRRRGRVMADRFHHRVLRTPREVRSALAYVLNNARKHGVFGGRPGFAGVDPASSGRWFDGWTCALPRPTERAPVARGRCWLLRIGWWRHGQIDPAEIPGLRPG